MQIPQVIPWIDSNLNLLKTIMYDKKSHGMVPAYSISETGKMEKVMLLSVGAMFGLLIVSYVLIWSFVLLCERIG